MATHCERDGFSDDVEITPEMIKAGEMVILENVGGADLGGAFSASDLAREVYRAMISAQPERQ